MSAPDVLAVKRLPYPAWKVSVNGQPVQPSVREGSGQLLISAHAGMNDVKIRFVRTWDRTVGGWLSVFALVLVVFWILFGNRWTSS